MMTDWQGPITPQQMNYIRILTSDLKVDGERIAQYEGYSGLQAMSKQSASDLIEKLKNPEHAKALEEAIVMQGQPSLFGEE